MVRVVVCVGGKCEGKWRWRRGRRHGQCIHLLRVSSVASSASAAQECKGCAWRCECRCERKEHMEGSVMDV